MNSTASCTAALPPEWAQVCARAPFAGLVAQLTRLLGEAEYDTEHWQLTIRRTDLDRLSPGELFAVEIYCPPDGRQARLYVEDVHQVTATGATFSGRRLCPLTIAGLRRAIRDAKRLPRGRRPRIALLATVALVCDRDRLPRGLIGTVVEILDMDHVLVEFAGADGVALAIAPVPVAQLRGVVSSVDQMQAFMRAAVPVADLNLKALIEDGRA
ncbi:MAG: hypothetical protein CVU18_16750 [Betaproteobacteria bacterium HGW-Betaproteobacteria-12]|nr:MAG: hypothetical protein CVU18_16750 [Betaproteobacteria bacterium HGW-Betaproteobacteria-12]